jgi:hypothetical protein
VVITLIIMIIVMIIVIIGISASPDITLAIPNTLVITCGVGTPDVHPVVHIHYICIHRGLYAPMGMHMR